MGANGGTDEFVSNIRARSEANGDIIELALNPSATVSDAVDALTTVLGHYATKTANGNYIIFQPKQTLWLIQYQPAAEPTWITWGPWDIRGNLSPVRTR